MLHDISRLLKDVSSRQPIESFTIESGPAYFEAYEAKRTAGKAAVFVTRSSITIRFAADNGLTVPSAASGESNGRIVSADGTWSAPNVNDAGRASDGDHLFETHELEVVRDAASKVAATRLVFAGVAWSGTSLLDGRQVVACPLTRDVASHHDRRMAITIEGDVSPAQTKTIRRACSFVSGHGVEVLRYETYSAHGSLIRLTHHRGFRRVGRAIHSPFVDIADEHRMRAWTALAEAMPRLLEAGVPIDIVINHISGQNQVVEIEVSAALMMLAAMTAIHHRMHGDKVNEGATSRRRELAHLNRELKLGLSDADIDRFEKLRVELLETGFFHKFLDEANRRPIHPDHPRQTRAQLDIKFIRDVAHLIVFRLCGYSGPFYSAEQFAVRELAEA